MHHQVVIGQIQPQSTKAQPSFGSLQLQNQLQSHLRKGNKVEYTNNVVNATNAYLQNTIGSGTQR